MRSGTAMERPAVLDNFKLPGPAPQAADPASLDALADMVAAGRRPALWLGNGAKKAGGATKRLLDLGFALYTRVNDRGVVPEDAPQVSGAFHNSAAVEKRSEERSGGKGGGSTLRYWWGPVP